MNRAHVTLLIFAILSAGVLSAQTVPALTAPGPRYEAYAGFSRMRGDVGTEGRPNGWAGAFTIRLNRHIAFDALSTGSYARSQYYDGNTHLHTVLFGPRLSFPIRMVTPFIHIGAGYARWHPGTGIPVRTGFAKTGGLGFDLNLPHGFAWRLLQADYIHTPFRSGDNAVFSTGLIYRFGRR